MTEDDKFRIELHRSDVYYGDPLAADRIEDLIAENKRLGQQCEGLMQAGMNNGQALIIAEAKLAKAVEAIKQSIKEWESPHYGDEDIKINNGVTGFYLLRTVLAELGVKE